MTDGQKMTPTVQRVSPFIGTILMMQSPIHGTWPPIGTLRPMRVALNYRDRTSSKAAPGWSSFAEPALLVSLQWCQKQERQYS